MFVQQPINAICNDQSISTINTICHGQITDTIYYQMRQQESIQFLSCSLIIPRIKIRRNMIKKTIHLEYQSIQKNIKKINLKHRKYHFLYIFEQISCFLKVLLFLIRFIIKSIYNFLPIKIITMNNDSVNSFRSSSNSRFDNSKIIISQIYALKQLLKQRPSYNMYEGVDIQGLRYVHVYLAPDTTSFKFSKKIKEPLRNKFCPAVIWTGTHKINNVVYNAQIHEKYGPSFKSMFQYIKDPISQKDFLLLMYQLIRLIEKYGSLGYVFRQLDMKQIIFSSHPQKIELSLLNVFPMRKSGEEAPVLNTRFCARGAHLGLKANIKDDLQSICYILMHIHSGNFLINFTPEDYLEAKTNLNLGSFERPLPELFIEFYHYVVGLNYSDQVNYFRWRNTLYTSIGKAAFSKPYEWMRAKKDKSKVQTIQTIESNQPIEIQDQLTKDDKQNIKKLANLSIRNNDKVL